MEMLSKPVAFEKMRKFQSTVRKNGYCKVKIPRVIEFVYDNTCNFKCKHCSTRAAVGDNVDTLMSIEKVASVADEAHECGVFDLNFHGGELLIHPDRLFELIKSVKPHRFYTFLTSNGFLMTEDIAKQLAENGIDHVNISLDSINPEIHDEFRGMPGAYDRAVKALEYVKQAGMTAYINVCATHSILQTNDFEELCKFSYDNGYKTLVNIAMPVGCWKGNYEEMLTPDDFVKLDGLRIKYKNLFRDIWDPLDSSHTRSLGCQAMSKLYVTPSGDIFPCSFMHVKVGNVYENTIREILDYAYTINWFGQHQNECLVGQNIDFVKEYLSGDISVKKPADAKSLFFKEDYI